MLRINGGEKEGGGQMLRTALALSTITQTPFEMYDIRKGRDKPGMKAQHLKCIEALKLLCDAKVDGAELGSEKVLFIPNRIKGGNITIDVGTAGALSLVLQSVILPCFFAEKKVKLTLTGGTDGKWAPPIDYLKNIILPHLNKFCDKIEVKMLKRGYYPAGGGIVEVTIEPKHHLTDYKNFEELHKYLLRSTKGIHLTEQGTLMKIRGVSHASKSLEAAKVAERQAQSASMKLNKIAPIEIKNEYCDTLSAGSGIVLWALFAEKDEINLSNPTILGADALGEKGKRAEEVGEEAAKKLIEEINSEAPVDEYLADNLIPFLALFGGEIRCSKISSHTHTNIHLCEQFLGKCFEVEGNTIKTTN